MFDVTGAGDTVIAVLTMGIAAGLSLRTSAHLANAAAGLVVETPHDLRDPQFLAAEPVHAQPKAASPIAALRVQGLANVLRRSNAHPIAGLQWRGREILDRARPRLRRTFMRPWRRRERYATRWRAMTAPS